MITSDKQYAAAQEQLNMLTSALTAPAKKDIPSVIEKAGKAQLRELIEEIRLKVEEYESLKASNPSDIEIHSLDDLMVAPIRYRIASHMSIDAFGRKVGISARQIARYELDDYQNTNSRTLRKILRVLNVRLEGTIKADPMETPDRRTPTESK